MRYRQYVINRVVADDLSIAQRNLLANLPRVEIEDEDGHDARVAGQIVTLFDDVCAEFFPRSMRIVPIDRGQWVDVFRELISKGLEGGRYADLLPLAWLPDELHFSE